MEIWIWMDGKWPCRLLPMELLWWLRFTFYTNNSESNHIVLSRNFSIKHTEASAVYCTVCRRVLLKHLKILLYDAHCAMHTLPLCSIWHNFNWIWLWEWTWIMDISTINISIQWKLSMFNKSNATRRISTNICSNFHLNFKIFRLFC